MIAMQVGAFVVYAVKMDVRHAAYWLFAAGITAAVTL